MRLMAMMTVVILGDVHGLRGACGLRGPCGGKLLSLEKSAVSFGGAALLAATLCAGPTAAHGEMLKLLDAAVQQQQQQEEESTEQALQLTAKDRLSLRKESAAVAQEEFSKAKKEKAARDAKVENAGRPATKKDIADLQASVNTNMQLAMQTLLATVLVGLATVGSNIYLNRDKL
mmetsp:Transcript_3903/g.12091  ORF Transcript_3903/g.12091 Transcript_3903/m.12091 type:complete len:175 (+) Transcript_3903:301-825(+)|eukprot:CAMPEP_0198656618 /NCGR_PEP_ID=MMETSP1467-20131203/10337_1 /TAXON_ID=1462469 /ORGANISM="unid. sp., Strain CCMP2135" /LENGTH=174 /DNA_ID=CAMNT_0044392671 /DNA_START=90 /DNA_END=614 /DNA_ORIENTATION=+